MYCGYKIFRSRTTCLFVNALNVVLGSITELHENERSDLLSLLKFTFELNASLVIESFIIVKLCPPTTALKRSLN